MINSTDPQTVAAAPRSIQGYSVDFALRQFGNGERRLIEHRILFDLGTPEDAYWIRLAFGFDERSNDAQVRSGH